jgi:hypothetical protein
VITGEEEPDKVGPPVSEVRRRMGTGSGNGEDGPWAETRAGPDWLPGAFLYFYFVFFFSFSVFLFLLYLLQKCFNSIQTTIRNFLKIKTTFQNSNKHGFNIKSNFQIKLYNLDKGLICINQSRNRILK